MDIAVLGSGAVGRTLAGALDGLGHQVVIGTRAVERTEANPAYRDWQEQHPEVRLAPFADAAKNRDIVLNALNGANALAVLESIGADVLDGTVLLDLALPLDLSHGLPPTLVVATTDSLAEQIQRALPRTHVVKSLNTVYMAVMVDPARVPGDHVLFLSGEDTAAKNVAGGLLAELGWTGDRVIDLGGIETARGPEMYSQLFFGLYGALGGSFDFNIAVHRG